MPRWFWRDRVFAACQESALVSPEDTPVAKTGEGGWIFELSSFWRRWNILKPASTGFQAGSKHIQVFTCSPSNQLLDSNLWLCLRRVELNLRMHSCGVLAPHHFPSWILSIYIYIFIYLFIYLLIYLFIDLFILFIYLFIYLFIEKTHIHTVL